MCSTFSLGYVVEKDKFLQNLLTHALVSLYVSPFSQPLSLILRLSLSSPLLSLFFALFLIIGSQGVSVSKTAQKREVVRLQQDLATANGRIQDLQQRVQQVKLNLHIYRSITSVESGGLNNTANFLYGSKRQNRFAKVPGNITQRLCHFFFMRLDSAFLFFFLCVDQIEAEKNRFASANYAATAEKNALMQEKNRLAAEKDAVTAEKNRLAAQKNAVTAEKNALVEEKNRLAAEKDAVTAEKNALAAEVASLRSQLSRATTEAASERATTALQVNVTYEKSGKSHVFGHFVKLWRWHYFNTPLSIPGLFRSLCAIANTE